MLPLKMLLQEMCTVTNFHNLYCDGVRKIQEKGKRKWVRDNTLYVHVYMYGQNALSLLP